MVWLAKSVELIVGNARCCLWTAEGDGRRGIFLAAIASGLQLATVALAAVVVRRREKRAALAAIMVYGAITVRLLIEGGTGESQLWLNLAALVVAGFAILADRRAPLPRHPVEARCSTGVPTSSSNSSIESATECPDRPTS